MFDNGSCRAGDTPAEHRGEVPKGPPRRPGPKTTPQGNPPPQQQESK